MIKKTINWKVLKRLAKQVFPAAVEAAGAEGIVERSRQCQTRFCLALSAERNKEAPDYDLELDHSQMLVYFFLAACQSFICALYASTSSRKYKRMTCLSESLNSKAGVRCPLLTDCWKAFVVCSVMCLAAVVVSKCLLPYSINAFRSIITPPETNIT